MVGIWMKLFLLMGVLWGHNALAQAQELVSTPQGGQSASMQGVPLGDSVGTTVEVDPLRQSPRFRYNPAGRRDPFLSFVAPNEAHLKNMPPLQQVALAQLKLIGVAWSGGRASAMIETPDGKTYPVQRGTRMGTNRGQVKDVGAKSIVVEEPYINIFGRTSFKQIIMKLQTKQGGGE